MSKEIYVFDTDQKHTLDDAIADARVAAGVAGYVQPDDSLQDASGNTVDTNGERVDVVDAREGQVYELSVQSVTSGETDTLFDSVDVDYPFEVVEVESFVEDVTAGADFDVKVGGTSCLDAVHTPTADTREEPTLSGTASDLQGADGDAIALHATTDGTGALTGAKVRVRVVPQ